MTLEEHRQLTSELLQRQPGFIFDALMMHQCRHGVPPFAGVPGVPWCTCSNCTDMPTDRERKCCGQYPADCVIIIPHFSQYCLENAFYAFTGGTGRTLWYLAKPGSLGMTTGSTIMLPIDISSIDSMAL